MGGRLVTEDVPPELEHTAGYVRELRRLFPTHRFPNYGVPRPDIAAADFYDTCLQNTS